MCISSSTLCFFSITKTLICSIFHIQGRKINSETGCPEVTLALSSCIGQASHCFFFEQHQDSRNPHKTKACYCFELRNTSYHLMQLMSSRACRNVRKHTKSPLRDSKKLFSFHYTLHYKHAMRSYLFLGKKLYSHSASLHPGV